MRSHWLSTWPQALFIYLFTQQMSGQWLLNAREMWRYCPHAARSTEFGGDGAGGMGLGVHSELPAAERDP